MDNTPKWVPVLFGGIMILMGALILGASIGIVPTSEGEQFLAPPAVIASLGLGLTLGGLMFLIPNQTSPLFRTFLFLLVMAFVAITCNWTAFAPNVVYDSSTSLGALEISEKTSIGGRIVFGIVALLVDATIILTLVASVRAAFHGTSEHKCWLARQMN